MRILLAVDGSPDSREAIEVVRNRPWPAGSQVKVISVVQPTLPPGAEFAAGIAWTEIWREQIAVAESLVAATAQSVTRAELPVETVVRQGDPRKEIVAEAGEWPADLILVGSHGHSRLEQLLVGSVSQFLVSYSPCSVEVVRARESVRPAA